MIPETIGDCVAVHVKQHFDTQRKAAKAWGCSPTFLGQVIEGHRRPNEVMLAALAMERVEVWVPAGQEVAGFKL